MARWLVAFLFAVNVAASDVDMGMEKGVDFAPSVVISLPPSSATYDMERMYTKYKTIAMAPTTNMFYLSTADTSHRSHDGMNWGLWSWKASSITHGTYVQLVALYEMKWLSSPIVCEDFPDSNMNTICVLNHLRGTMVCRVDSSDPSIEAEEKFAYELPEPFYSPPSSQLNIVKIGIYEFIAFYTPPFSSLLSAMNVYTGDISTLDLAPDGYNSTELSEWQSVTPRYSDSCDIFVAKAFNDTHVVHCAVALREYSGWPDTEVNLEKLWCVMEPQSSDQNKYKATAGVSSAHYSDSRECQVFIKHESSVTVYHSPSGAPVWKRESDSSFDAAGFSQGGGLVHIRVKSKAFDEVRVEYYLPCYMSGYMACNEKRPEWSRTLPKPYMFEMGSEYVVVNTEYGALPWIGHTIPQYISLMIFWPSDLRSHGPYDAVPILYMLKLKDGRISSRLSARELFGVHVMTIGIPTEKEGLSCFRVLSSADGSHSGDALSPKVACLRTRCSEGYGIMQDPHDDPEMERDGCVLCPPGTYRDDSTVGVCMHCPANSITKRPGSTYCEECPYGEFSIDGISCKTCPKGMTTEAGIAGCSICERSWCVTGLCSVEEDDGVSYPVCTCDSFIYGDRCERNFRVHLYGGIGVLIVCAAMSCMGILSFICFMIQRQSKRASYQYAQLTSYVDENLAESKAVLLEFDKNRTRMEWELDFTKVHIKKRIGSGATAIVYLAVYEGLEVAVKEIIDTMSPGLPLNESDSQTGSYLSEASLSLKREVDVLKSLRHPHLLHCWGMIAQPPCLVVEIADGGTLSAVIHGSGHVSEARAQELALHVARGMAFLHSQNLIHRDLKPENVLIVRGAAKVADFGITRKKSGMMTSLAGTVRYMAPEVMEKQDKSEEGHLAIYDNKADVYSYGILLWEIYHRKYPFYEYEWESQVSTAVSQGIRPVFSAACPLGLRGLVEECWREQPWERPSFNDIVERLSAMWRSGTPK